MKFSLALLVVQYLAQLAFASVPPRRLRGGNDVVWIEEQQEHVPSGVHYSEEQFPPPDYSGVREHIETAKEEMIASRITFRAVAEDGRELSNTDNGNGSSESANSDIEIMLTLDYAIFEGLEFSDKSLYWGQALAWVESNSASLNDWRIAQRYALMCIYYATNNITTPFTEQEMGIILPWGQGWGDDATDPADECSWHGVTCDATTGRVTELDLHNNRLTGVFPPEVMIFQDELTVLDLEGNYIYNLGFSRLFWISGLTKLETFNLGDTGSGYENQGIPEMLMDLTDLKKLILYSTSFGGPMNDTILDSLTNLEYLDIGSVSFGSTLPSVLKDLTSLQYLYMDSGDWEGTLTDFIGTGFSAMKEMWIDNNPRITGTIPTQIGLLTEIVSLSFTESAIDGPIPTEMGNLNKLERLWLNDNSLTGAIPTELGSISVLTSLYVQGNSISGSMPTEVCALNTLPLEMDALGADCQAGGTVTCSTSCCTCCGTSGTNACSK